MAVAHKGRDALYEKAYKAMYTLDSNDECNTPYLVYTCS